MTWSLSDMDFWTPSANWGKVFNGGAEHDFLLL